MFRIIVYNTCDHNIYIYIYIYNNKTHYCSSAEHIIVHDSQLLWRVINKYRAPGGANVRDKF